MAKTRQDLQNYLKTLVANVYFQPPENVKLKYPCIIYSRTRIDGTFANNDVYRLDHGYQLVYLTRNPDDSMIDTLAQLPTCRFQREYVSDQLYHDVYIIYWN